MFGFLGNRKIGVFGTSNSGKTVLLTSLYYHLATHDKSKFPLGLQGDTSINNVEIISKCTHFYNFDTASNALNAENPTWLAKSTDWYKSTFRYKREGCFFNREVTFIDIPGERTSDLLIYTCKNHKEWSKNIEEFSFNNRALEKCLKLFEQELKGMEFPTMDKVSQLYKKTLCLLLRNQSNFITPSTFVLDTNGSTFQRDDTFEEEKILRRPIWDQGDFFPLPPEIMEDPRFSNICKKCEKNFHAYKNQVITPLYDEIHDCDDFIVCVDVFSILANGRTEYFHVKKEIEAFFNSIKPKKFNDFLMNIRVKHRPSVAFVATKSDMAKNPNNLLALLHSLIEKCINFTQVNKKEFICTACKAFLMKNNELIWSENGVQSSISIQDWPDLPNDWSAWKREEYKMFLFSLRANPLPARVRYRQVNLNRLFDYLTEGIDIDKK